MRTSSHILQYIAAGILVMILGGFAGWYMFVHRQIASTTSTDAARGLGNAPSFSSGAGTLTIGAKASTLTATDTGSAVTTGSTGSLSPRLWKVTQGPVAGFGFEASTSRMYFAERGNGNILSADPALTKVARLTNTLLPKIYEALFAANGAVVLRSLSPSGNIISYAARIATSTDAGAVGTLSGVYLPPNIRSIAARPASLQLFWLLPEGQSGVSGITSDWKGGTQKRVFASALGGWQLMWQSDGKIYLLQNPTDDIAGYAFRLGTNGYLSPLLGGISGLTILPRSASTALIYGSSAGGTLALFGQASASSTAERFNIRTTADKCVWAPAGQELVAYCAVPQSLSTDAYLRNRFAGALHTQDAIWKVNVSAGSAEVLYRPDPSLALDVENIAIDETGSYIGFMNAADKSLWLLRIQA